MARGTSCLVKRCECKVQGCRETGREKAVEWQINHCGCLSLARFEVKHCFSLLIALAEEEEAEEEGKEN